MRFVASHFRRLSVKTLKVYLAGVQYWAILNRCYTRLSSMPRLYYLIRAVRRIQGNQFSRPRRVPVTLCHLRAMFHRIPLMQYTVMQKAMFRAATSLAFFGLLRVSEYTSEFRRSYSPDNTLLVSDVSFNSNYTIMSIHIKASKTDPFREGCIVRVAAVSDAVCPVAAMRNYLSQRTYVHGPLFLLDQNCFLLRQDMVLLLRRCFPSNVYLNTHSFRIGGASMAASAGIPDSQIQILGRWSSDAYRRYIHISDLSIQNLANALISAEQPNRIWDPIRADTIW